MPTSIPYDPALALGNIVHPAYLEGVETVAGLQLAIDLAQDELSSLISLKHSLNMTVQELIGLNVDTAKLNNKIGDLDKRIVETAGKYADISMSNGEQIFESKKKARDTTTGSGGGQAAFAAVHSDVESPIDYNRTQIKKMPLSADSFKMDAQYFSFDENRQSAENTIAAIKGYVGESTSFLGESQSFQATTTASMQVSKQLQNHDVAGTLVISIGCTHKDAILLAPFILDVDKAIRVWNTLFPKKKIDTNSPESMEQIADQSETAEEEDSITILSGATYGSSFIGMVHVLRTDSTQSSQTMMSIAATVQGQYQVAGMIADASGGFGVDASFADDIKNLLSTQSVQSHISLITMGSIPSLKANDVQIGVKQFADFDPAKMMEKLATLANATTSDQKSVAEAAAAARTGGQMLAIQGSTVTNVMAGLADIEDGKNKMLDINSLMTAMEDYVDKALAGNIGVPINYYLKSITRSELMEMWVEKYYPNKYVDSAGDDSTPQGGKSPTATPPTDTPPTDTPPTDTPPTDTPPTDTTESTPAAN